MRKSFICVAIAIIISSCSERDNLELQSKGQLAELKIGKVSLAEAILKSADSDLGDGSLGVFIGSMNGYVPRMNIEYSCINGIWQVAPLNAPLYLGTIPGSVGAYYPYKSNNITAQTDPANVVLSTQVYSASEDLSYSKAEQLSYPAEVGFSLKHTYSMLTFTVLKDNTYVGAGVIDEIKLQGENMNQSCKLNMLTGELSEHKVGEIVLNPNIISLSTDISQASKISLLVVPSFVEMTSKGITVKIKIDNNVLTATIPLSDFAPQNMMEKGVNYSVVLTVKGTKLSVSSVKLEDWTVKPLSPLTPYFSVE